MPALPVSAPSGKISDTISNKVSDKINDTTTDQILEQIADYASSRPDWSDATLNTAGLCLTDALGCAIASLDDPQCARLLGPWFPEYRFECGVPVPGTDFLLDPVKAAFDIGTTVRWLDFSDTTYVGGHASDNIGAILAAATHASALRERAGRPPLTMRDVFDAMIKAYEIQGRLSAANRFDMPAVGLDHVIYVKVASTAVAAHLLGADRATMLRALSNAWLDGQALNAYRHTPNAGTRKGWAGGDASSRGLWLAQLALRGDMGYPQPLSADTWGFEAVHLGGKPVKLDAELGSFVMDNVIFKLYPCQRNTTTAVESAARLRPWLDGRIYDISKITLYTQDEAMRRVNKTGPLPNRAARDHSLQYVVAIALLRGALNPDDYSDEQAADPRIDWLRERMVVIENPAYTRDHHDMAIRSCANAVQIELANGEVSPLMETSYPVGDPSRRAEATPMLTEKFHTLTRRRWSSGRRTDLLGRLLDNARLARTPVREFMSWVAGG
jgi:2-methylcitrate dehydratase